MFFWISIIVLCVYYQNGWTTIGPGLAFCLAAIIGEAILDTAKMVRDGSNNICSAIRKYYGG